MENNEKENNLNRLFIYLRPGYKKILSALDELHSDKFIIKRLDFSHDENGGLDTITGSFEGNDFKIEMKKPI